MFSELDLACLFNRIAPGFSSDIQQAIYSEYSKTYYDKYTLFELISFLDKRNIYISVLSKKNILKIISEQPNDIPDKSYKDAYNKTKWQLYNLRYMDYTTYPHIKHVNENIICIQDIETRIEIMPGDIFQIEGNKYKMTKIKDNCAILNETEEYPLATFMEMLDSPNVTIMKNQLRENIAKHAYMERSICMHISQ
jgi:hypothetical protein